MKDVKENIIKLSNCGTKTVKFVDRTFNANAKRANEILQFIIENHGINIPLNVCFHFEIAGDILKEDTFKILESAPKGLFQLEIGMQTFNEKTLEYINRRTDSETGRSFKQASCEISSASGVYLQSCKDWK